MNRPRRGAWVVACAVALALSGCGGKEISSPADASTSALDSGLSNCSPAWEPIDFERHCVLPPVTIDVCQTSATHVRGLRAVCAVDPNGTMYYGVWPDDFHYEGAGWTFGPNGSGFPIDEPPLTSADAARCAEAIRPSIDAGIFATPCPVPIEDAGADANDANANGDEGVWNDCGAPEVDTAGHCDPGLDYYPPSMCVPNLNECGPAGNGGQCCVHRSG